MLERGARRAPYRATLASLAVALELNEAESLELEAAASRARARGGAGASRSQARNNLSAQLSSFVGRENDIVEIRDLLNHHRLVSVVGAAGIGKTRLALRVANDLLEAAFEGIWFVDLASLKDGERIPSAILSALDVTEASNRPALEALVAHLNNKRVLLILDNCEHVIHGAAVTTDMLLQRCSDVTILATSREVLGVDGESVVRVPTLPETDAVALFVERAREADSHFGFTESQTPAIVGICERLDGIALAIELAAARINVLSLTALADSLNERFSILTGGKRTAPPRHRTLRAMLDWSYDLLDEREQRVLRALSVFVGGFTLELANEPLEILSSLVDKSLIQYEFRYDTTRYRLLESTREYANEKLSECNEGDSAARAHALAMLALVERFSPAHAFLSERAWKTQVQPESDNLRAALQWAFGPQGDVLTGQRLAGTVNTNWWSQMAAEGRRWTRHAIDTCDETTPPRVRAALELTHAKLASAVFRGQTVEALRAVEVALRLYEEAGDSIGVAMAQGWLGAYLASKGRVEEAEHLLRTALATARQAGAQALVAQTTSLLANALGRAGDIESARLLFREVFEMYRAADSIQLGAPAFRLAEFEFWAGNHERALSLVLEAAGILREFNRNTHLCQALGNAAAYAVALSRFDEAHGYAREALSLAVDGGFDLMLAWAVQHLAAIAALTGGDARRAAGTLGFVNARVTEVEGTRHYTEQQEYDRVLPILRDELGAELDALVRQGAGWSNEQALDQVAHLL
jgi:predicted ATPase